MTWPILNITHPYIYIDTLELRSGKCVLLNFMMILLLINFQDYFARNMVRTLVLCLLIYFTEHKLDTRLF